MKRRSMRSVAGIALLATLAACSGSDTPSEPTPLPPPPPPASVLLKDVSIERLPAPYFHFEYDAGQMTRASFASGFLSYTLAYANGRLSEMRNDALGNGDRLTYGYDDLGRVGSVKYIDPAGTVFAIVFLGYTGQQLTSLERDRRVNGGFVVEKTMAFTYHADGNVSDVTEHRPAIAGAQDESTIVDHYDDYDTGLNVDGFSLLHSEFFDHLVLLPQVQLQKTNPRTVLHTGGTEDLRSEYTYLYDAQKRPITRTGVIAVLTGPNAGLNVPTTTTYSYY